MTLGGINLGNLTNYLFFFDNGSVDANWQGATKGFIGDVAVDGLQAAERTSGDVPYAGTIYTNANTLGAWQNIINQNIGQATGVTGQVSLINGLHNDLVSAIQQINALPATPGFTSVSSGSLDGLNTQNGINETFVINVTSGLSFSNKINITGDAGDIYILRWDTDGNPNNGYQGQLKPSSGGAIVPHGGLKPTNFINVAGDINSSGGDSNPLPPYPQGPRYNDGQGALINGGSDFSGGGFFTGYLLTTGSPDIFDPTTGLYYGETSPLSNGIFVGGWYTLTTKFSMTSGTSGVYITPPFIATPAITVKKYVSADNGLTWQDAETAPGPFIPSTIQPQFKYTVTNTGNVTLTNVALTDNVYGTITIPTTTLVAGQSFDVVTTKPWQAGQHENMATVTGMYNGQQVSDTDLAHYFGTATQIQVIKYVSPDNGATWDDANTPPGPFIPSNIQPQFRYVVTNIGNTTLSNITLTDNVYGPITIPTTTLAPGGSFQVITTKPWQAGQHTNTATATGTFNGQITIDTDDANYFGALPSIRVIKYVSDDNGATWQDADTPPGPSIPPTIQPQFRYVVTNTGDLTISNIALEDNVFGTITIPTTTLAPGQSFEVITTKPWQDGQHTNLATVTGTASNGQEVTDDNPANYFGTEAVIKVIKYVSADNGATWQDANTPPGPFIPSNINPMFRYVVTNIGTQTLTDVTLDDNVYGPIILPTTTLTPGESIEVTTTHPWAAGQHTNTATATGTFDGQQTSDMDDANYFGEVPDIQIIKYVSADNGLTWQDANTPPGPSIPSNINPMFRYVVTNTGNIPLNNITVEDNIYGTISIPTTTLNPGAFFEVITTEPWQGGQHTNIATVTGHYDGHTVTDEDEANYYGINVGIQVKKYVSADNGATWIDANTPPGPTIPPDIQPQFKYVVTNTGNITLTNVTLVDDIYGPITIPTTTLTPGQSFDVITTQEWQPGQHTNIATVTGHYDGHTVTDTDKANYLGSEASIQIIKYVSVDNGLTWQDANTSPGPLLPAGNIPHFKYVVTNTGTVELTNITVTDNVLGLIGTIPALLPGNSYVFYVPSII